MQSPAFIEQKLKQLKPLLTSRFYVENIGSYVGSYSESSDIDILVSFKKTPGWEFFDLKSLLEENLHLRVDLVSMDALRRELKNEIIDQTRFIE